MADIIVRIPARQLSHFLNDKMTSGLAWWGFSKKPRKLKSGSYIFFTRPEGVVFAAPIRDIKEGEDLTDEINPIHMVGDAGNFNACWNGADDTQQLDPLVSDINYSQQGYRYLTANEQRRLRKRLRGS